MINAVSNRFCATVERFVNPPSQLLAMTALI